ncbi:hypothetical protein [Streptomyces sp. NPDC047829]|uniref:hypothetical protein n=1 Tax=Streptomyces sp. NPDC047829 TaxID=3154609 RepID=UPI0033F43B78
MNSPDHEMSHPLERVTGEKDVPPEEEEGTASPKQAEVGEDERARESGEAPSAEEGEEP